MLAVTCPMGWATIPEPHLICRGPQGSQRAYLAAVHAAFQVASTEHGGGDDATIHVPVVADLVGD